MTREDVFALLGALERGEVRAASQEANGDWVANAAVKEGILVREMVKRDKLLPAEEIDDVLDLRKMTEIGVPGGKHGMVAGG